MDDCSRVVWVFLLKDKATVSQTMINFFAFVKRKFDKNVKVMRSDNKTKFNALKPYFLANCILFKTSFAGTPQQNGLVERKHQHILNVPRNLLFQGNLPIML